MRTSSIGAIQIIERFINKEYVIIGTIEMTDINEWWWTCYDAKKRSNGYKDKPLYEGCATSRKNSVYYVRSEYKNQLKLKQNKNEVF